jgi:hypothetical protein
MARDAIDLGVIKAVGRQLVVRRQPFEYSGSPEDKIGFLRGVRGSAYRGRNDTGQGQRFEKPSHEPFYFVKAFFEASSQPASPIHVNVPSRSSSQVQRPITLIRRLREDKEPLFGRAIVN